MGGDSTETEVTRSVVKKCNGCEKEIPVACKLCPLCKCYVTPAKSVKTSRSDFKLKVVKKCTECEKEIAVACKICPLCKCQVAPAKSVKTSEDDDEEVDTKVRRTERVNRERPDFFNAMKVDNQFKKKRKRNESTSSWSSTDDVSTDDEEPPKRRRGRPKGSKGNQNKTANAHEKDQLQKYRAQKLALYEKFVQQQKEIIELQERQVTAIELLSSKLLQK